MSVGLLGAMKGLGEGLSDAGKQMAEDAYETKRQERLEAAKVRLAEMQHAMNKERDSAGFAHNMERDSAGFAHNMERDEIKYDRDVELERMKENFTRQRPVALSQGQRLMTPGGETLAHNPKPLNDADRTKLEYKDGVYFDPYTGEPVQDHRGMMGGSNANDAQMLQQWKAEIAQGERTLNPQGSDMVTAAVLSQFKDPNNDSDSGFAGWTRAYNEMMKSNPDFFTWREMVYGIPQPPGRQAQGLLGDEQGVQPRGSFMDHLNSQTGRGGLPGNVREAISGRSGPAPAQGARNEPGYPEGTRLHGPGGKIYVVRDGRPVPVE